MVSVANRHEDALRQWRRWERARTRREREDAIIKLWRLSEPEIVAAIKKLAGRLSESWGESVTPDRWLSIHGMNREDARSVAFPAVWRAAKGFEPAKGTFQTYAFLFILGELHRYALEAYALSVANLLEDTSQLPEESVEQHALGTRFLSRIVGIPAGELGQYLYETTAELSSEEIESCITDLEESFPDQLRSENPALEVTHATLIARSIRAADREGKMVRVSDLAQMLRAREHRAHMKKRWRSHTQLAREFRISDKTAKAWLDRCEQEGIVADDLSCETLTRLARIMTPRRGPAAGQ